MDVPLAPYNIRIHYGLKGAIRRRSSTFSHQAGVVGLSALFAKNTGGKLKFSR